MEEINSYYLIVSASVIIIISYFFNLISKKTNVPSVLLLISLGLLINSALNFFGYTNINWFPALEILGIIGLIMIVLESALDLELTKEKTKLILKAFFIAFISIGINIFVIAKIFQYFCVIDFFTAAVYATPISIISSAIVIPSITTLPKEKQEFLIYESTFSDILGIIAFYSLLSFPEHDTISSFSTTVLVGLVITIIMSFLLSYLILFIAQKISTQEKLFLLMSILVLFFAIGKIFHLSSLIIILVFGLIINNKHLFIPKFLYNKFNENVLESLTLDFKLITFETSFIIRTFFFVIFGITLSFKSIFELKVIIITSLLLLTIYISRFIIIKLFSFGKNNFPEYYIAPRGLITILLFYAIPDEHAINNFNNGILFLLIIISNVIMSIALIKQKYKFNKVENNNVITTKTDNMSAKE